MKQKRTFYGFYSVFIVLLLSGCSMSPDAASSHIPDVASVPYTARSEIVPSSGVQSDISSTPSTGDSEMFDKAILQLIGAENRLVKEVVQGECETRVTGMGAAELLYYAPYIGFTFSPETNVGESYFKQGFAEGYQKENPFEDGLEVMWIHFMCDYDATSKQVTNQRSLQRFVNTEQEITYDSLCESLQQTPELSHTETVYYLSPVQGSYNEQGDSIDGGVYTALYTIENVQISVAFIKSEEKYIALFAKLSL